VRDWTAAASPLRSATYIGPIRLRHACDVTVVADAAAASQPAGWYRPTAYGTTDRPEVTAAKYLVAMVK